MLQEDFTADKLRSFTNSYYTKTKWQKLLARITPLFYDSYSNENSYGFIDTTDLVYTMTALCDPFDQRDVVRISLRTDNATNAKFVDIIYFLIPEVSDADANAVINMIIEFCDDCDSKKKCTSRIVDETEIINTYKV